MVDWGLMLATLFGVLLAHWRRLEVIWSTFSQIYIFDSKLFVIRYVYMNNEHGRVSINILSLRNAHHT